MLASFLNTNMSSEHPVRIDKDAIALGYFEASWQASSQWDVAWLTMTGVPKPTLVSFVNTTDGVITVAKVSVSIAPFNAAPIVASDGGISEEDHIHPVVPQAMSMALDISRPLWVSFGPLFASIADLIDGFAGSLLHWHSASDFGPFAACSGIGGAHFQH